MTDGMPAPRDQASRAAARATIAGEAPETAARPNAPKMRIGRWHMPLPRSRWLRVLVGVLFILFGLLGFRPILGFWMIPVGLIILSNDFALVRRRRRRFAVWWGRRRSRRSNPA